jgi:hypothetical protein
VRRLNRFAFRLYPAAWRERYGAEFNALLDDVNPRWWDVLDVLRGALQMQLSTWSPWKIAAAFGLVGALAGGAASFIVPHSYTSTTVLRFQSPTNHDRLGRLLVHDALSRHSLTDIIIRERLYESERTKEPLENTIERMRRNIRVVAAKTNTFGISFTYPDPVKAQSTARALTNKMMGNAAGLRLEVLDPASMPVTPTRLDALVVIGSGLGLGILTGLVVWAFSARARLARVATAFGLIGGLVGAAAAFALPHRYASFATIEVRAGEEPIDNFDMRKRIEESMSRAFLAGLIAKQRLYPRQSESKPLEEVIEILRHDIQVEHSGPGVFTIGFVYGDPGAAQRTTAALVSRVMVPPIGQAPTDATLEVVDPASFPVNPVSPNHSVVTGIGLVVGLIFSVFFGQRNKSNDLTPA